MLSINRWQQQFNYLCLALKSLWSLMNGRRKEPDWVQDYEQDVELEYVQLNRRNACQMCRQLYKIEIFI